MRIPFIVRWPGHVPAGVVDADTIVSNADWLPTLCAIAGVPLLAPRTSSPLDIDGIDLSSRWLGSSGPDPRGRPRCAPLHWTGSHGARALRDGPLKVHYKYVRNKTASHSGERTMCKVLRDSARRPRRELFNADMLTVYHIPSDPGEAAPLSHEAVGANRMRLLREMLAAQACRNETHWAPHALPPAPCGDPAVLNALRQTRRPDLRGFKNPAAVSGSFLQGVRQWL